MITHTKLIVLIKYFNSYEENISFSIRCLNIGSM